MAKHNFSSKRNAIYNAVCSTTAHPSARTVYEMLKPDIPDLSLGTVYRNIALFKSEGKVNVICNVNGEERIDGNTRPHPHFVCNCCGKVFDVGETSLVTDDIRELTKTGYTVESKYILYYGICPECSDKTIGD
jgi:Fur family peroxide stress response transcriptional regulator